jgi:hypothetical protein
MAEQQQEQTASPGQTKAVTLKYSAESAREVGLPSQEAISYMMSIASMLSDSALVTKDVLPPDKDLAKLRQAGWKEDEIQAYTTKIIKANMMAKMLVGREMGMQAMESLQDINVVKGNIFVRYPQLITQIEKKGYEIDWMERSNTRAALQLTRNGKFETFEYLYEDAKAAGLTAPLPSGEPSQYTKRPRVMLTARVASEAYRVTGGRANVYTVEEKPEVLGDPESTMAEPT